MRDVELVVRHFAFRLRLSEYRGNLKKFLDDTCDQLNKNWVPKQNEIQDVAVQMDEALAAALKIFSRSNVFRSWDGKRWERLLNRAIFDVITYTLADPAARSGALKNKEEVIAAFKQLCSNEEFRASITSTTKSKLAVRTRFAAWASALLRITGVKVFTPIPPE